MNRRAAQRRNERLVCTAARFMSIRRACVRQRKISGKKAAAGDDDAWRERVAVGEWRLLLKSTYCTVL
jgi:hypothetical protein